MIKRCNDFGAGGVSVAIGELADGLYIDLNKVTKKYEGLDGTELAISESQERMAVALAPEDVDKFIALANEENLEATPVAKVTAEPRLNMVWNGMSIVNISREFLNSNGAEKHQKVHVEKATVWQPQWEGLTFSQKMKNMVGDLNICSKKGLSERFDSTIGAATVLMPFGGAYQLTPQNAMVAKLPVDGETSTCSGMAWGFNPFLMSADQYKGAQMAVIESVTKLVASGFRYEDAYLTFQEYFERLGTASERWGKPLAALLGALDAQMGLGIASIGGKDSMSGSFEKLDVPPTLVSFATAIGKANKVVSTEFKKPESTVVLIRPIIDPETGCPNFFSLRPTTRSWRTWSKRAWWHPPALWATAALPRLCSRWALATTLASRCVRIRPPMRCSSPCTAPSFWKWCRILPPVRSWARPPRNTSLKPAAKSWIWPSCRRSGKASWSRCTPTERQAPPWKRSTAS